MEIHLFFWQNVNDGNQGQQFTPAYHASSAEYLGFYIC